MARIVLIPCPFLVLWRDACKLGSTRTSHHLTGLQVFIFCVIFSTLFWLRCSEGKRGHPPCRDLRLLWKNALRQCWKCACPAIVLFFFFFRVSTVARLFLFFLRPGIQL